MKICILGWYGTETLGDRAILAGLLNIFNATFDRFTVKIGSLYPFVTKRTLFEDAFIYDIMAPGVKLDYFDVKNKLLLNKEIATSDFVIMGGGPIMDLAELEIIAYAFRYAKKKSKKTAVLGCGIGPLHKNQFINVASCIFTHSDLIILRDQRSLNKLVTTGLNRHRTGNARVFFAHDPAILPVGRYLHECIDKKTNNIAVNFRKFPKSCFESKIQFTDDFFSKLLIQLSELYDSVNLVPMHTFYVGGDDRYYLSELQVESNVKNMRVIHKPMNLFELFYQYSSAAACIGMRYHSVVFQTFLNGNNFIFDYTEEVTGKINSFLEMLEKQQYIKDRYINLQANASKSNESEIITKIIQTLTSPIPRFTCDNEIFEETLSLYSCEISKIW